MAMYGADVTELRALAARFDRTADQLDANRMAVGNAIQISAWVGPFATRFRAEWNSEHSVRVHSAAELLRTGAQTLLRNANDQDRASAVDGGASDVGAITRDLTKLFASLNEREQKWDAVPASQGLFAWLNETVLAWQPAGGLPVLDAFDFGFMVSKIPNFWKTDTPGFADIVTAISLADVFTDPTASTADKFWAAGGAVVDVVSGEAKTHGGPIGYLAGVATAQVWDVVNLASHADFSSDGVQTTWNYLMTNPGDAIDGGAQAIVDYIPDLIDNLWPW